MDLNQKIKLAEDLIVETVENFGIEKVKLACSWGKDSMVLLNLALDVVPEIRVFTVLTHQKPRETFDYANLIEGKWKFWLERYQNKDPIPGNLHLTDPDKCCELLKVKPTKEALVGVHAWITGLRSDEGFTRSHYHEIEHPVNPCEPVKVNPILRWSEREIWQYLATREIPIHPWYGKGYRSLGCACCTEIVGENQPERSGRWQTTSKCGGECGIHTMHTKGEIKGYHDEVRVMIAGLGEVGQALSSVLDRRIFEVHGVDINESLIFGNRFEKYLDVLHICFPCAPKGQDEFVKTVVDYIREKTPELTIIHSTVPVGTTRKIIEEIGEKDSSSMSVVHSPVRGMHRTDPDFPTYLRRFVKYIGANDDRGRKKAVWHLIEAGFKVEVMGPTESTEFTKLMNLNYYALLITNAKEIKRLCEGYGIEYYKVMEFARELRDHYAGERGLRPVLDPHHGPIGGHCVIPAVQMMLQKVKFPLMNEVLIDNYEWIEQGKVGETRWKLGEDRERFPIKKVK